MFISASSWLMLSTAEMKAGLIFSSSSNLLTASLRKSASTPLSWSGPKSRKGFNGDSDGSCLEKKKSHQYQYPAKPPASQQYGNRKTHPNISGMVMANMQ